MAEKLNYNNQPINLGAIPKLYSFIVLRKENFGGYLFNPYLYNEISLNKVEMRILEHCNGNFFLREIIDKISEEFSYSYKLAEKIVNRSFKIFKNYYAISWDQEKHNSVDFSSNSMPFLSNCNIIDYQVKNLNLLSAPISILWEITHKCNLRCKHCLIDAGKTKQNEITLKEAKKILKQLAELKVFKITFGGGEPLVRADFLDILNYASNFNFGIKLTTNGTLVNKDLLKLLKNTNVFSVQVSVDGIKQTHNAFRRGKASFENAISALKMFSDAGYWTIMSTAITKYNINEIEKLLDLAIQYGLSTFKASPFLPIGRGKKNVEELAISPLEMKNLAKIMVQKKNKYKEIIDIQIDGLFPWLFESYSGMKSNDIKIPLHIGCSAGVSQVVITSTGDILPCPYFRDFIAGNLRECDLKSIWKNSEVFNIFRDLNITNLEGKCKNCDYIPYYCQGGCRASAFNWTGNLYAHDPNCWKEVF